MSQLQNEGLNPPPYFLFALFPSLCVECASVIAVPDRVKCAKNAIEEESPKEDTQPVKKGV